MSVIRYLPGAFAGATGALAVFAMDGTVPTWEAVAFNFALWFAFTVLAAVVTLNAPESGAL